jgi:RNA polymerase sigma-70 factor (ECF subfamily)
MVPDERQLLAGLRAGEDLAYETLVRAYGGRLLQVARRFLGDADAGDAVQESFLAAFKAIERFDGKSRVSTWLHRIVVNTSLMRLRKKSHQVEQSLEPLLPTFLEDGHRANVGAAWVPTPEEHFEQQEIKELVQHAIHRLPVNYRSVLLLRDIEGLSGAEAGEVLGISPNAVKVRLHRARLALREVLDPHMPKARAA